MKINSDTYVPAIKWRQGEYQALSKLSEASKDRVVPLVTIPSIEFDFEEQKAKKTIQEHIKPFAKRFKAKWNTRPAWIDFDASIQTATMDSGQNVITHIFSELRKFKAQAVPVASLDLAPQVVDRIEEVISKDGHGVALRARLEHIMLADFGKRAAHLLGKLNVAITDTDLIIDLGVPAYQPYDAFSSALIAALAKIPQLKSYRSFVVMGTAFPDSMKDVNSPGGSLLRHDWLFFKTLLASQPKSMRRPAFGDYTIVNPAFAANFDMRMVKPAGKLVYTTKNQWVIRKGGAFRDNPKQMHDHCAHIISSGIFCGAAYSDGDDYIDQCASKKVGPSNLPWWKQVGINHHIMHALEDVATLGGPS